MIKIATSESIDNLISIKVWHTSIRPYSNRDSSPPIRFNLGRECLEYYDDQISAWNPIEYTINITPGLELHSLLEFYRKAQLDEIKYQKVLKKYPEIKLMKNKVDMLLKLVAEIEEEK